MQQISSIAAQIFIIINNLSQSDVETIRQILHSNANMVINIVYITDKFPPQFSQIPEAVAKKEKSDNEARDKLKQFIRAIEYPVSNIMVVEGKNAAFSLARELHTDFILSHDPNEFQLDIFSRWLQKWFGGSIAQIDPAQFLKFQKGMVSNIASIAGKATYAKDDYKKSA